MSKGRLFECAVEEGIEYISQKISTQLGVLFIMQKRGEIIGDDSYFNPITRPLKPTYASDA